MSEAPHVPVMLPEVLAALKPGKGQVIADGTFGAGGYTSAILDSGARVLAFDRDLTAIEAGRERFAGHDRLVLIHRSFDTLSEEAAIHAPDGLDGAVFDLGVSSMQLDQSERGFSFMRDGPLDMRMGDGVSAEKVIAELDQNDLKTILWQYGEERRAGQLAAAIVRAREKAPITTTGQLAALAGPQRPKDKIHPATRMFQAIRIFVNDELGQLVRALMAAERSLKPGGRLVVVTFHSLEDRIVKKFLAIASGNEGTGSRHLPEVRRAAPSFILENKKALAASEAEAAENPRARSAKLRAAIRTDADPTLWARDRLQSLGAPSLVFSDLQERWSQHR
ncbi:16S rRNA (cytosine(1402)-N(4))-methyltransferase RsmH [Parvularcula lutaonensis]|uniref:16S rRNA (cytosine(1402)-N(4))-methyltransferase RsmH n=1 Tax=Parvularcula lutaonensis TaxID=491923 RepID=UPI00167203F3|nr:16S rRNA (cytosine(1402)-N(4))-methyltransferase RsmH [Parvularcula lutaonensis]GGY41689.1 ribosomal RNA small subunit methyltransferase H [Parvularcula lutaonensis]